MSIGKRTVRKMIGFYQPKYFLSILIWKMGWEKVYSINVCKNYFILGKVFEKIITHNIRTCLGLKRFRKYITIHIIRRCVSLKHFQRYIIVQNIWRCVSRKCFRRCIITRNKEWLNWILHCIIYNHHLYCYHHHTSRRGQRFLHLQTLHFTNNFLQYLVGKYFPQV